MCPIWKQGRFYYIHSSLTWTCVGRNVGSARTFFILVRTPGVEINQPKLRSLNRVTPRRESTLIRICNEAPIPPLVFMGGGSLLAPFSPPTDHGVLISAASTKSSTHRSMFYLGLCRPPSLSLMSRRSVMRGTSTLSSVLPGVIVRYLHYRTLLIVTLRRDHLRSPTLISPTTA